ncbi:MAG TPA: nuclease-related domain-containing protein [Streptosporangiaceae bacterium]
MSTPSSASGTPEHDGPPAWPGVPSQRQQPPAAPDSFAAADQPPAADSFPPDSFPPGSFPPGSFATDSFATDSLATNPPAPSEPAAPEPQAAEEPAPPQEASFWDWKPDDDAEDMRFSIDDETETAAAPTEEPVIVDGTVVAESPGAEEPAFTEEPAAPREEGIGHRLGPLDHIFGHTRMGMWRRRMVIAVVIGIVVSILLNWQVGVTLAVLFAVADTIFRSRTPVVTSPLPGVKLTRAQRQTQNQLNGLEKAGYKALHSRLIPDSEDHIDHLVIGPAGVFAIDSEYWDKHLPIRTKNARQLWHGPFSMKDRLEHARWEAEQASELLTRMASPQLLSRLPGGHVTVRPAMAVYGPKIPWDVATIRDVDVFKGGRLRVYLRRYARQNDARPLDPSEIDELLTAAHRALPHLDPGILAPQPA